MTALWTPLRVALLLPLLLPLLVAARPYIVGGADDPHVRKEKGPARSEHARIAPLRRLRYADRFAIDDVALSADGVYVAAVGKTSRQGVRVWEVGAGRPVPSGELPQAVTALAFDGTGRRLALGLAGDVMSGGGAGVVGVHLQGEEVGPLVAEADGAIVLAWEPHGDRVAVGLPDGLGVWDLRTGKGAILVREGRVEAVTWSGPDELYVAAQGGAALLRVRAASREVPERWEGQRAEGPLGFSPTGRLVVEGGERGLRIDDLWQGGPPQRLETDARVTAVGWSGDGRVMALGTADGEVLLYAVDGVEGRRLPSPAGREQRKERESGSADARAPSRDERTGQGSERGAWGRDDRDRDEVERGDRLQDDGNSVLDLDRGRAEPGQGGGSEERVEEPTVVVTPSFEVAIVEQLGGDPRTNRTLLQALTKNVKSLEGCWKKSANRGEPVAGDLVFDLGITPDGEGTTVEEAATDTIGNEKLTACVRERLRKPLFGPGVGSMDVRLRIELRVATSTAP
jgi:WD40 repeat protein